MIASLRRVASAAEHLFADRLVAESGARADPDKAVPGLGGATAAGVSGPRRAVEAGEEAAGSARARLLSAANTSGRNAR